jgi:uncharacterized membrane protein (UPF0127 family)
MILNSSKNTVLSEKEYEKKGLGKIIGLIGRKKESTVVFKTRFGIHTFFLKFPIDVVILSNKNEVVFLKQKMMPNRILIWNIRYDKVIELPNGKIEKSNTKIGDILEFNL